MTTFPRRASILPLLTFTAVAALCLTGLRAAPVDALKFTIDEIDSSDTLSDDGVPEGALGASADENWEYVDRRLFSAPDVGCVEAEITTGAFVFVRLNRVVSGSGEEGVRCGDAGGVKRDWRLMIYPSATSTVCDRLRDYDGRLEEGVDGNGAYYCVATGLDSPRIRVENLYARKVPASTNIALLMKSLNPPPGHGGYEIRSEGKGAIQGGSVNRSVNYHGTARLWEFIGKAKAVDEPFEFNVHMTFEKVTLQ